MTPVPSIGDSSNPVNVDGQRTRCHEGTHARGCDDEAVVYELVAVGGIFQIHKLVQSDNPAEHTYTAAWRHSEARAWWLRVLLGAAR
jgi:hypothetical protein